MQNDFKRLKRNEEMKQYHELLKRILNEGTQKGDRTGTGTLSVFGHQMRFDLSKGFPLVTTKKVHWKSVVHELLWFLKGDTNVKYLQDNGVRIWDEWANEYGDLGSIYGKQWRSWGTYFQVHEEDHYDTIDQISEVIEQIKTNPNSRRLIVSAWNVGELNEMALHPCHLLFQFYVNDGKLSCQLYQRSGDIFLGIPYNIASYSLLVHMIANECGLRVGEFIHTIGDAHIYTNHIEQCKLQLTRDFYELPDVTIRKNVNTLDVVYDDIKLINYKSHPTIKGKVAV